VAETGALDTRRVDFGSCDHSKRRMRTACNPGVPGTWYPMVHRTCPHNELEALCARVLAPLPPEVFEPLGSPIRRVFKALSRVARRFPGHRWSNLETAQTYEGSMRVRYQLAAKSLKDQCVGPADARLDCFLKAEKVNPLTKWPKPRMIFPRSPRYNLEVASRLKPFEHWLWGYLTARRLFGGDNSRVVAKGLGPRQRANLISRKFNNFRDCVCFEVDGRAFEAHVGPWQLEAEHAIYKSAYPRDKGLAWLLEQQLSLKGKLPCGAKFSRSGGRASGDFNTGMGNSLIMVAVVVGAMSGYRVPYDLLCDGDNSLIFLERKHLDRVVSGFGDVVKSLCGHEMALERPVDVLEEIRFGQSSPVALGGNRGLTMVRDPWKVMSGAFSSHRHLREPKYAREFLTGVAMCELSLGLGIPVLQAYASSALGSMEFSGRVRCGAFREYFMQGAWLAGLGDVRDISAETRESFARAFGLDPTQQVALERQFRGITFGDYLRIDGNLISLPPSVTNVFQSAFPHIY